MKQFGEGSLRKLAMDAPTESIFHFEGEDYKEKRKVRMFQGHVRIHHIPGGGRRCLNWLFSSLIALVPTPFLPCTVIAIALLSSHKGHFLMVPTPVYSRLSPFLSVDETMAKL